jgi:hypothetical protein
MIDGPKVSRLLRPIDVVEQAALGASFLCLVHCTAVPLLLALLPALSQFIAFPESVHLWLLMLTLPTSSVALAGGYRRHRQRLPVAIGIVGLFLIGIAALALAGTRADTLVTISGSCCLAAAHIGNWRLRRFTHRRD